MNTVNLYTVDGSTLVATVQVPDYPDGDPDVIIWRSRVFKIIDPTTYWECAVVAVL